MNLQSIPLPIPAWAALAVVLAAAPMWVRADTDPAARARYESERARCVDGRSNQDRATCLQEAEAAYALARRGKLVNPSVDYARSARGRCQAMKGDERRDCLARVDGQGTTTGSSAAGGTLTELVTPVPVPVPVPTGPPGAGH